MEASLATDDLAHGSQAYRDEAWFERLTKAKLSPLIVIAFIALLAVFAAAAAAVSCGVHHFARH